MSLPQNDTSSLGGRESNVPGREKQISWCALLTGAGRAAVAVIELGGPSARRCLGACFHPAMDRPWRTGQIRYGRWGGGSNATDAAESVVVLPLADDRFEVHCHGGQAAIDRIMEDLTGSGLKRIDARRRPEGSNASDPVDEHLRRETIEVLTACTTTRTAAIAMNQLRRGLSHWRTSSLERLHNDHESTAEIAREARQIATAARLGLRLTQPSDVVLAGPPNVGKSSLINAVVGYERSITMDLAGTTRDVLDAETVLDGWPIRLRDTAGMHRTEHAIERQGIDRALAAVASADLIIQVSQPGIHLDQSLFDAVVRRMDHVVPMLLVLNKADLIDDRAVEVPDGDFKAVVKTVATTGTGIPELIASITDALRLETPEPNTPIPLNERQREWVECLAKLDDDPAEMIAALRRGC